MASALRVYRRPLLLAACFALLMTPAERAEAGFNSGCIDQQMACNQGCLTLGGVDSQVRCICLCGFTACECVLGGTGYGNQCVESVAAICNSNFTGLVQSSPLLPAAVLPNGFRFDEALSGMWVDPPFTDGFTYSMTGASRFTAIVDFPTGFAQPFTVSVGEQVLGSFGPGQSVDFSGFPGGGVTSFSVMGIAPEVDTEDPEAFPLRLAYDTPAAAFTMTSLPEASPTAAAAAVLIALAALRRWASRAPVQRVGG